MMDNDACSLCRFFAVPDKAIAGTGECRRNPPAGMPMQQPGIAGPQLGFISFWPPTEATKWCGEFSPRALQS